MDKAGSSVLRKAMKQWANLETGNPLTAPGSSTFGLFQLATNSNRRYSNSKMVEPSSRAPTNPQQSNRQIKVRKERASWELSGGCCLRLKQRKTHHCQKNFS